MHYVPTPGLTTTGRTVLIEPDVKCSVSVQKKSGFHTEAHITEPYEHKFPEMVVSNKACLLLLISLKHLNHIDQISDKCLFSRINQ